MELATEREQLAEAWPSLPPAPPTRPPAPPRIADVLDHYRHELHAALESAANRTIRGATIDVAALFREFCHQVERECITADHVAEQYREEFAPSEDESGAGLQDQLLNATQAAELLQVQAADVRKLRESGDLVGLDVNPSQSRHPKWRYQMEEIRKFLQRRASEATMGQPLTDASAGHQHEHRDATPDD